MVQFMIEIFVQYCSDNKNIRFFVSKKKFQQTAENHAKKLTIPTNATSIQKYNLAAKLLFDCITCMSIDCITCMSITILSQIKNKIHV